MAEKRGEKKAVPKGNSGVSDADFYSRIFTEAEKYDFKLAAGIEDIDEEIALLRVEIKKAISGGDARNLLLLVKATAALDRLVRTRYQITASQGKDLKTAIANVIRDIFIPLGINIGSAVMSKKIL